MIGGRATMRIGQLLLVLAAAALWGASRFVWVEVDSANGLGQPHTTALTGATWSTALVPLALMLLAAALAAGFGPTWQLRVLAAIVASMSAVMGYLAISLWVNRDVAVRAAHLAEVPVADLVGTTQRHYGGAVLTVVAAVVTLVGAVLLLRSPVKDRSEVDKYEAPARRREAARGREAGTDMSERMIWDALDEGRDPTNTDNKGR